MPRKLLPALALAAPLALAGCVYVPPVIQGNFLGQDKLQKLEVGMTRSQVAYLFGKPALNEPFYPHTWYYVYYYKPNTNDKEYVYRLTVHFKNGKVARFTTSKPISSSPGSTASTPKTPAPVPAT